MSRSSQPLTVKQELELRLVLAELIKSQSASDRRVNDRHSFQQKIGLLLNAVGSQGGSSHLAIAKDLSRDGVGFLYNGRVIYPKTRCLVLLPSLHDGVIQVEGVVVRCRAVRHSIHEVGVRFNSLMDVSKFIDLESEGEKPTEGAAGETAGASAPPAPPSPGSLGSPGSPGPTRLVG